MDNGIGETSNARGRTIVRTGIIGVITNVLLAASKAAIGLLANSIAVILDAVNNLSDALSSLITIVGARIAGRKPDKKHPLGHGRTEDLSAFIVSAVVLYAGVTALIESIKKIITPDTANYDAVSLVVIILAIFVKLILGTYVKRTGKKVNSDALKAAGTDALFDALVSASVLASAVLFMTTGLSLEAYVGVLISLLIIKSGIGLTLETVDKILGARVDRELIHAIKKTICEDEYVFGAYDLILHSYGPETFIGSVHIEVPDIMTADEIDLLERRITSNVYRKHGVYLAGIGIYSMNTKDDEAKELRSELNSLVMAHDGVLQFHGFYYDPEKKHVVFDVILDFEVEDRKALIDSIRNEVERLYPDLTFHITMDVDI